MQYICKNCGSEVSGNPSRIRVFCSHKCSCLYRHKNHSGDSFGFGHGYVQKKLSGNPSWKGKEVTYRALHNWISRNWGSPNFCEFCMTKTANRYDWSSKLHEYSRERKDWQRLCRSCHMKYDYATGKRVQKKNSRN